MLIRLIVAVLCRYFISSFAPSQIICFVLSGAVQAVAFFRWRRRSDFEKQQEWCHYGWFTGLCLVGSFAGALAFAARMAQLSKNYPSRRMQMRPSPPTQAESLMISAYRGDEMRFTAAHFVLFPIELGCIIAAMLLVLRRLLQFTSGASSLHPSWLLFSRAFFSVVVIFNSIGFFANVASSVYFSQGVGFTELAYEAYYRNDSIAAAGLMQSANAQAANAIRVSSVQRFCEALALLMVIAAFLVVGVRFHFIVRAALSTLLSVMRRAQLGASKVDRNVQLINEASVQGRHLQRKVLVTFFFIFFAVLLRSVFTIMYGVALAYQDYDNGCSPNPCNECKNVYSQILFWILFTPEFQHLVMIFASPAAQLIAFWGMSGTGVLEQMQAQRSQLDSARIKDSSQRKEPGRSDILIPEFSGAGGRK